MRILHVFGTVNCGGAETRIMELYRNIDRSHIQFDFLVLDKGPHFYTKEIGELGGRIFSVTHPRISIIKHVREMFDIMKRCGPFQAIHSHTSFHSGLSLTAAKYAGIKRRICHSRTTSTKNNKKMIKKIQLFLGRKLIISHANSLLTISESAGNYLYGSNNKIRKRIKTIPNAINFQAFKDVNEKNEDNLNLLRKELGISGNELIIGHIGRFDFMKNHKFIIELAHYMDQKNLDFIFILIGEGNLRIEIEQMVNKYKLAEKIKFLGLRTDIPQLMHIFDVLIMPSFYEGLGGVVIEAQASGTQSVVSNTLPPEVDFGLDLIDFVSLSSPKDLWINKILEAKLKPKPSIEKIEERFLEKGFTLEKEEELLLREYRMN